MKTCQNIPPNNACTVILFYKYTFVKKPEDFKDWQKHICDILSLKGRVLIAKEGINATLEGLNEHIDIYSRMIQGQSATSADLLLVPDLVDMKNQVFANLDFVEMKTSIGTGVAFKNLKIKVRPEIVSLGLEKYGEEDIDPNAITGTHLKPLQLKHMYETGEDFVVIDMRNDYEFKVGHFERSINPPMENFRELPNLLPQIIRNDPSILNKKVVTVCTGGVRCEKASGYLLKKGFTDVYQLDGGMHKFMEEFPGPKGTEFKGGLFTFDDRVVMDFEKNREIIGKCEICNISTERFDNCANDECHKHMIICDNCGRKHPFVWCRVSCKEEGRTGQIRFKDMHGVSGGVAI